MRPRRSLCQLLLLGTVASATVAHAQNAEPDPRAGAREQIATVVDGAIRARAGSDEKSPRQAWMLRTGAMRYMQQGIFSQTESSGSEVSVSQGANISNGELQWQYFRRLDLAYVFAYRLAYDQKTKRTLYQAGVGGVRYFPLTNGVPVFGRREFQAFTYDFKLRPWVEGGVSLGRYLMGTFGEESALDLSAEFAGAYVGLGTDIPVTRKTAVGVGVDYDYVKGYGPLKFYAGTVFARVDLTYFY